MPATVVVALCAVLLAGQAGTYGRESVRIYVLASESAPGDANPDQGRQGRLAAVRDLRDAIRRKAGLRVVDDRGQADVIVEVTDREQQDAGEGGFGGVKLTPLVTTTIRLHVTSGDLSTDMKGVGPGTGSRAAKDAADRLLKWIVRNHVDRRSSTASPSGTAAVPWLSLLLVRRLRLPPFGSRVRDGIDMAERDAETG